MTTESDRLKIEALKRILPRLIIALADMEINTEPNQYVYSAEGRIIYLWMHCLERTNCMHVKSFSRYQHQTNLAIIDQDLLIRTDDLLLVPLSMLLLLD